MQSDHPSDAVFSIPARKKNTLLRHTMLLTMAIFLVAIPTVDLQHVSMTIAEFFLR